MTNWLLSPNAEGFLVASLEMPVLGQRCDEWAQSGLWVRWLRGERMCDKYGVLSEFAAALQFPWYFGWNWDALEECLGQMNFNDPNGAVICIYDADNVMVEDQGGLTTFVDVVQAAQQTYSTAIDLGERWDRPPVPFHIVVQLSGHGCARWKDAGAELVPLGMIIPLL